MKLTESEIFKKHGTLFAKIKIKVVYYHKNMNSLVLSVDMLLKEKNELSKISKNKINFSNRLKYAEEKSFSLYRCL